MDFNILSTGRVTNEWFYDDGGGVCGCMYACMPVEQENKTNTVYIYKQPNTILKHKQYTNAVL